MAEERYDHKQIEQKWQKIWADEGVFTTPDIPNKKKAYVLDMFPYPSGDGLHVGHPKGYIATDVYSRMKMMQGYDVLHPMGWDAFGLPAENYAIKNKVHPRAAVEKNIARFKEQLSKIGFTYDWDREINTTDPAYYKWTQWIFLQLYKKGLAYESYEPINWCPSCQTGLANEDLDQGRCERCGSAVEKRPMRQWMLKITDYAEKLLDGLDDVPWPESIKESQRNWIGKSEGATFSFQLIASNFQDDVRVFTTRPDTLFGVTYLVVSPEHELIERILPVIENPDEVRAYVEAAKQKTEIDRTAEGKEKTGVQLKGVLAKHPATGRDVPVWIADYVLAHYGTGAIMAVPAHDERDMEFAETYGLPIAVVIGEQGALIDSGEYTGMKSEEAKKAITEKYGQEKITYKLRDWVFSRQRYWGEPIPVIHCAKDGVVPVPEDELPVLLPDVERYEPTGTGESPLAEITEWVNVKCPSCGGDAKRETNTMPQWAGSSWYYLRYIDPNNSQQFVDPNKEQAWMPVDVYVGGAEHATRHLIYARFWHKVLHELGYASTSEPFLRLENVGLILAEDGRKMSKRWGNVINPDDIVEQYGADTLRVYEMFMGPFHQAVAWSTASMNGPKRFLERIWRLQAKCEERYEDDAELISLLHRTIARVTEDTQAFRFNTAIAALMEFLNTLERASSISRSTFETFLLLVAPYAPHIAEELWERLGNADRIVRHAWPVADKSLLAEQKLVIPVQVNGKVRGEISIEPGCTQAQAESLARSVPNVQKYLAAGEVKHIIYVPDRLIGFVL